MYGNKRSIVIKLARETNYLYVILNNMTSFTKSPWKIRAIYYNYVIFESYIKVRVHCCPPPIEEFDKY